MYIHTCTLHIYIHTSSFVYFMLNGRERYRSRVRPLKIVGCVHAYIHMCIHVYGRELREEADTDKHRHSINRMYIHVLCMCSAPITVGLVRHCTCMKT